MLGPFSLATNLNLNFNSNFSLILRCVDEYVFYGSLDLFDDSSSFKMVIIFFHFVKSSPPSRVQAHFSSLHTTTSACMLIFIAF